MDAGPYRRVLLKLSGESFARQGERGTQQRGGATQEWAHVVS